jgi:hypothetical protein
MEKVIFSYDLASNQARQSCPTHDGAIPNPAKPAPLFEHFHTLLAFVF